MMKKIFVSFLFCLFGGTAMAQSGYKAFADVGLSAVFLNGENVVTGSLASSHGYQFGRGFVGAGLGLNFMTSVESIGAIYLPLFGQARVNFQATGIKPYLDFKGGYTFGDIEGGFIEPSMGVSFPVARRLAINFGFAYRMNMIKVERIGYYGSYTEHENMHSIALKFGFEF